MKNLPDITYVCFARKDREHCECYTDQGGDGQCCRCRRWHPKFCQKGCRQSLSDHSDEKCAGAPRTEPPFFDLIAHLLNQQEFSIRTFGPPGEGQKPEGVVAHLKKEIQELEHNSKDKTEWIDVAILAFDSLIKLGASPEEIASLLVAKQIHNEQRKWPDWRKTDLSKAIEHVRTPEELEQKALEAGTPGAVATDVNGTPV